MANHNPDEETAGENHVTNDPLLKRYSFLDIPAAYEEVCSVSVYTVSSPGVSGSGISPG